MCWIWELNTNMFNLKRSLAFYLYVEGKKIQMWLLGSSVVL